MVSVGAIERAPHGQRRSALSTLLSLLGAGALLAACFDTKQIPEGANAAGRAGSSNDTGGRGTTGGAAGSGNDAGAADGGSSTGGAVSGGVGATGGVNPAGGRAGGSSRTGGAPATGGVGTGGRASGGSSSGGKSSGGSSSGGSAGQGAKVEWFSFVNGEAPSTLAPNGALGVNGIVYGRRDSCATLEWNPMTRCASGMLCNANNGENWGAALVFEFKHTGPDDTPSNTTALWNPDDVGALGVAWEVTGSAPGLQVWVLNMAPEWNGECNAETCEIAGPPDGTPSAAPTGQLSFDNMKKDDWGGSGIAYQFDPSKVHALQFKIPAIIVGPTAYSFCLKSLGIVR